MTVRTKRYHRFKGQALIIGLLFVVVVSTLVLALISRSLKDVKVSTETEEELRAFSAAEAGLEQVLNDVQVLSGGTTNFNIGNVGVTVTTEEVQWSKTTAFTYPDLVRQDDTRQFFLTKYDETAGGLDETGSFAYNLDSLDVLWGQVEPDGTGGWRPTNTAYQPGVEATLYYKEATSGEYKIKRFAYDAQGRGNFDNSVSLISGAGEINTNFGPRRFAYRATLSFGLAPGDVPLFLRVRFLFNGQVGHPLGFAVPSGLGDGSTYYPPQGYKIISQAESTSDQNGAIQRIEAFKSYPILPALFDYAVFSGGDLVKP